MSIENEIYKENNLNISNRLTHLGRMDDCFSGNFDMITNGRVSGVLVGGFLLLNKALAIGSQISFSKNDYQKAEVKRLYDQVIANYNELNKQLCFF